MNRNDEFEKSKITKVSTNKVACNVYFDAFSIEKVRFQNFNYTDKTSIDCYLDFEDVALLAADAASGRIIKELEAGQKTLSMGGSKSSKNYNGSPESRIISLGRSGDKIFINMSRGKGKLGDKGQIMPDGSPDLKISVPMTIDKFRSMMIYIDNCICGYLPHMVNGIVMQCIEVRKAASANK